MRIIGYCYGIRFERKLCEEVKLHLAYRWKPAISDAAFSMLPSLALA